MEDILFKHSLPLQIRFNDVDKFGHVNNAVYLNFYDLGKTNYFGSVCPNVNWERDAILVVHLEVDFISQIYGADDSIAVQTAVTAIGTKSFDLVQRLIDTDTNDVKCICRSTMVTYDLKEHKSKPLTEEWINAICSYEGKDLRKKK
ncbi:acyl-CoA thioesterase [Dysgonomonas sp. 216]|uniref:acyl-CoA thioesterase n=1 Tax=Dysgonomonas sp. 216 TaxID=2302934 RepID=UPI0013D89566|nr:thioesterase family protein [Dysgonomonas sp. 216]NDW17691.1 acyl-CoA thioesterase [Dysgonomonas sp. 216]